MAHRDLNNLVLESRKFLERHRSLVELCEAVAEIGSLEQREAQIERGIEKMGDLFEQKEAEANARLAELTEEETAARETLEAVQRSVVAAREEAQRATDGAAEEAERIRVAATQAAESTKAEAESTASDILAGAREEGRRVDGETAAAKARLDGLNREVAAQEAKLNGLEDQVREAQDKLRKALGV